MKAAAIGPGLEDIEKIEAALQSLFATEIPLVIDAGALKNCKYPKRKAVTIVTPHPAYIS